MGIPGSGLTCHMMLRATIPPLPAGFPGCGPRVDFRPAFSRMLESVCVSLSEHLPQRLSFGGKMVTKVPLVTQVPFLVLLCVLWVLCAVGAVCCVVWMLYAEGAVSVCCGCCVLRVLCFVCCGCCVPCGVGAVCCMLWCCVLWVLCGRRLGCTGRVAVRTGHRIHWVAAR